LPFTHKNSILFTPTSDSLRANFLPNQILQWRDKGEFTFCDICFIYPTSDKFEFFARFRFEVTVLQKSDSSSGCSLRATILAVAFRLPKIDFAWHEIEAIFFLSCG